MYDIEVIDGRNYAVISEGSAAYRFLKAMNSALLLKKLSSDAGGDLFLTEKEIIPLCKDFRVQELQKLVRLDLISYNPMTWIVSPDDSSSDMMFSGTGSYQKTYTFTSFGLEIMAEIKESDEDLEIPLS